MKLVRDKIWFLKLAKCSDCIMLNYQSGNMPTAEQVVAMIPQCCHIVQIIFTVLGEPACGKHVQWVQEAHT